MTHEQIRAEFLAALHQTAPETDVSRLDPAAGLRDQVEIDSFDFLNLMIRVGERLGVEVPERDYPRFSSIERAVEYLASRMGGTQEVHT